MPTARCERGPLRTDSACRFIHAVVLPMNEEHVLQDHTVIVAKGTMVEIDPAATVKVLDGALIVDATGRYLLPTFCDMHVHLLGQAWNMMLPPEAQLASEDIPRESLLFPYMDLVPGFALHREFASWWTRVSGTARQNEAFREARLAR